jgi:hypothetical protein
VGSQRPTQRTGVVLDAESSPDELRDARQRPAFRLEAGATGAPPQDPPELAPLGRGQVGRGSGSTPPAQATHAATFECLFPAGDTHTTDAQFASDRSLGESLGAQEACRGQATLCQLLARNPGRMPSHTSLSLLADSQ